MDYPNYEVIVVDDGTSDKSTSHSLGNMIDILKNNPDMVAIGGVVRGKSECDY